MMTLLWVASIIIGLAGLVLTFSIDESDQSKAVELVRVGLILISFWFALSVITEIWGRL